MLAFAADELVGSSDRLKEIVGSQVGLQQTVSRGSGTQFDLRSFTTRESLLSWAGAWASLIGLVWLICAVVQRRRYGREGRELGVRSMRASIAVACGLVFVCGVLAFEALALWP